MRNVIYLVFAFLILGCGNEDELTSKIEIENLYGIQDDPSDPVKHRVFEMYSEYGIPVYFNDTIGRIFVKKDVTGKDVYRYETLDLAWGFTSYDRVTYDYEYMMDPDEQLKALDIIENYLKLAAKPLHPFNFFVTKSAKITDSNDKEEIYEKGAYTINYRTLLMTGDWTDSQVENLPGEMVREMVKSKIVNYKDLLEAFNTISDPTWYGEIWSNLDPHYYDYVDGIGQPKAWFTPSALSEDWYLASYFTEEKLAEFRAAVRAAIGQLGFVNGDPSWGNVLSPSNNEKDLVLYITEMLRLSRDEFEELWGGCPLVMEKYEILYDIVANKLGVEL